MLELLAFVETELARGAATIEIDVLDPDEGRGLFAGEQVASGERRRSLHVWIELAQRLGLRLLTPKPVAPVGASSRVRLTFERLDAVARVRPSGEATERYGTDSEFSRISKLEDPGFVIDL